jgi:hypothetical protein
MEIVQSCKSTFYTTQHAGLAVENVSSRGVLINDMTPQKGWQKLPEKHHAVCSYK